MAIVKYHNDMNKVTLNGFTQRDINFFYAVCSKVKEQQDNVVKFTFKELRELTNYQDHSNVRLEKDLKTMYKKLCSIFVDGLQINGKTYMGTLFTTFITDARDYTWDEEKDEHSVLIVEVNKWFLPFFNNLVSNFTQFELECLVTLSSKHSKNLYVILKQWKAQGTTPWFKIDEIKGIMNCENYANRDFVKTIEGAAAEIKVTREKCFNNLKIEYKRGGRGNAIQAIQFRFKKHEIDGQLHFDTTEDFDKYDADIKAESKKSKYTAEQKRIMAEKELKKQGISAGKTNQFNNFTQRKYNFDDFNKALI